MSDEFDHTEWVTTVQGEQLTGYSSVTLRQFAREGRIKAQKWGRDWFLEKGSLLTYVQEMERLGTAKHDPTRRKEN